VGYRPIRESVKRAAAAQLKPLEPLGFPLIVVLANPHGADVALEPPEIFFALYGDPDRFVPRERALPRDRSPTSRAGATGGAPGQLLNGSPGNRSPKR